MEILFQGATKWYPLISANLFELLHLSATDNALKLLVFFRCCLFAIRVRDLGIVNWYS